VQSYSHQEISSAWAKIRERYRKPLYSIRVAVFNAGSAVWKGFLDITPEDVQDVLQTNVAAAFAFSREAILDFKENEIQDSLGKRGTLIFTGATASLKGNVLTSAFAAAKHGQRALSQSLAKEFGKQNIHVAYVSVDFGGSTELTNARQ
jgi:NAD(P)-dependent dehydrogenase (short-subunit alcohol dehydrogenase family)